MPIHSYSNPQSYSENNRLQQNFARESLSKISFMPNSRVLDLGCGDGKITRAIAEKVPEGCVIGTDISPEMIQHANQAHFTRVNLRFMEMDTSRNVFQNQFDVITSFNSLHWVQEQQAALLGIAQAAAPNAQIVLLLSHKKSHYQNILDKICSSDKWSNYFANFINPRSFWEKAEYLKLLENTNLKIESLTEKEMIYKFQDEESFKAFLLAAMANVKQIPESLRPEFLDDYSKEFTKDQAEINCISVAFWCLEVNALAPGFQNQNDMKSKFFRANLYKIRQIIL